MQTITQQSVAYIEENLLQPITLETVAIEMGYSKYHFHRTFVREVGMSATEYIKHRRLVLAAHQLLYTEERIIDIALNSYFESQEAFTRAFKKYYSLPPGKYRSLFVQKKGDEPMTNSEIKGWFLSGSHPHLYKLTADQEVVHYGSQSVRLESKEALGEECFATIMQQFKAKQFIGKRMKFTGFVKTEQVEQSCGLWMRVDGTSQDILQFDNMHNRPITGTTEWNYYTIILDIPDDSSIISIGLLLSGKGRVWVDHLSFEEVDDNTPSTNMDPEAELASEPMNLSFEEV
ncbi:right origin-binding protein [Geomicrobium sp. JCM 19037]|uniref:helix-turn-helix transcriptional regulator n=1 Tax=Geomicrobium sp. JCM 19037 TaxID=1460634 RepID=UPI00045F1C34|nr:AraC family transcriptional regulator [Geomicrobium sp. JCM 19037]GAK03520.1 right origin-binding protein [Geomicrobium sp. JCM 19037]